MGSVPVQDRYSRAEPSGPHCGRAPHQTREKTMTVLDISAADALAGDFAGDVITPDHPAYDDQRRIWNGEIDRRPAVLARCQGASDVAAALRWARERGLPVAVRGGGHGIAGHSLVDDGVVLDLSGMRGAVVDPTSPDGGGAGRRPQRPRRPGGPGLRAGDDQRLHQPHRDRRADARRRDRPPDAQDGPGDRCAEVVPGRGRRRLDRARPRRPRTPTCSGGCAGAAATSGSSPTSPSSCSRSGRRSWPAWSRGRRTRPRRCSPSCATSWPTHPTRWA